MSAIAVLKKLKGSLAFHLIFIVFLGILSYSNTLNSPFQLDDPDFIAKNSTIKDLNNFISPSKIKALITPLKSRYIGYLTFALNYKLHGLDVTGYHVFNLTIHILNAILVYFLVMLTFKTPYLSNPPESPLANNPPESPLNKGGLKRGYIALFSALLFVSHPIQTEAVTYIFQRLASLVAFFYLLSLVFYIKWRLTAVEQKIFNFKSLTFYLLSLTSAILAMKIKENAFTLPLVIMIYEFFFLKVL